MAIRGCRPRGLGISAVACASVLGLTSMMGPPVAFGAQTALVMGGTGGPTLPKSYVDAVENLYLVPNGYGAYAPQMLTTPEQAYPITGVTSLPVDISVAEGVTILDSAIKQQIAAGNKVVVFGYSQSAAVASQEMAQLAASSNPPTPDQLSFVLVGNPSLPNGGLNQRFAVPGAPLSLPSIGATFNYAPTASNTYPVAIYTQEYDGFADFPEYPINLLSVLNAFVGVFTQHFSYVDLTPQQISSAIALPTTGSTTTRYYMIPTANLPLLAPVRLIPLIGNPLADLLQPVLRVLVNLGYGSITNGWSLGPADVPTPFGVFPTNINPADVLTALANGAVRGVTDALNDLKTPTLFDTSSLSGFLAGFHTFGLTPSNNPSLLQVLAGFTAFGNGGVPVSSTGGIVNTLTSVVSNDIAVVKPLIDTALAIGVSLPYYDAQLFTSQLRTGNLLNAVAMPIVADFGLVPYVLIAGTIFPIVGAVAGTVTQLAQLAGLVPNPTAAKAAKALSLATASIPDTPGNSMDVAAKAAAPSTAKTLSLAEASIPDMAAKAGSIPGTPGSCMDVAAAKTASAPDTYRSNPEQSMLRLIGSLGKAVTSSRAHALAVGGVAGAGAGAGTGVTGTSGPRSRILTTEGTRLHHAHS